MLKIIVNGNCYNDIVKPSYTALRSTSTDKNWKNLCRNLRGIAKEDQLQMYRAQFHTYSCLTYKTNFIKSLKCKVFDAKHRLKYSLIL